MKDIFSDSHGLTARKNAGLLRVGQWRVRLPRILGFCGGVRNALSVLRNALDESGGRRIWLLGEIIHNDTVNQYFRERGVAILPETEIDTVFERAAVDDIVVIPAFGIPRELEARLRAFCRNPDQIVDTTCGYIKRIWVFAERMAAEGRTILVHGKRDHPETRATLSRALTSGNAAIILPDLSTARLLADAIRSRSPAAFPSAQVLNGEHLDLSSLAVVNQTTMLYEETCEIEAAIRDAAVAIGGDVGTAATLCRATQERQAAALEVCRGQCDLILVVGGYVSSNTTQLFRLAEQHCAAYLIRNATALARDRIEHYRPDIAETVTTPDWLPVDAADIGVLAGASCPPSDVGEVIERLRQIAATGAGEGHGSG